MNLDLNGPDIVLRNHLIDSVGDHVFAGQEDSLLAINHPTTSIQILNAEASMKQPMAPTTAPTKMVYFLPRRSDMLPDDRDEIAAAVSIQGFIRRQDYEGLFLTVATTVPLNRLVVHRWECL
jgi:hypothetical protein